MDMVMVTPAESKLERLRKHRHTIRAGRVQIRWKTRLTALSLICATACPAACVQEVHSDGAPFRLTQRPTTPDSRPRGFFIE